MKRFCPILLAATLIAWRGILPSVAGEGPKDCHWISGFDAKRPLVASKVTVKRAYFMKSAGDIASCPAEDAACQSKAFLVRGDVVLMGKTLGPYTCVAYLSARDPKQFLTAGWIRSSVLSPVAPNPSSKPRDWIGSWRSRQTGNHITISLGKRGSFIIRGEEPLLSKYNPQPFLQGVEATPAAGILASPSPQAAPAFRSIRPARPVRPVAWPGCS